MQHNFDEFLDLFLHYMCSRCVYLAGDETAQPVPRGSGRHSHNGEILDHLRWAEPTSDRLISAYAVYLAAPQARDLAVSFAQAYNRPAKPSRLPQSPELMAVRRILDHREETWIRHGIEHPHTVDFELLAEHNTLFPPPDSRYEVGDQTTGRKRSLNRYAVDLDRLPFTGCSEHRVDWDTGAPWAYTAAYTPASVYAGYRGVFYTSPDRDHLYADRCIPVHEWIHVLWDIPARTDSRHMQRNQQQIRSSTLPHIHIRTLRRLCQLINTLTAYSSVGSAILRDRS